MNVNSELWKKKSWKNYPIFFILWQEQASIQDYLQTTCFIGAVFILAVTFGGTDITHFSFFLQLVCIVFSLTINYFSFLASSGDAVYKVMSTLPDCKYTNLTCDPEVRTNPTVNCDHLKDSNLLTQCTGFNCTTF